MASALWLRGYQEPSVSEYGHRYPFTTVPNHKSYKTLWLYLYARKLSGIGRFRLRLQGPKAFFSSLLGSRWAR